MSQASQKQVYVAGHSKSALDFHSLRTVENSVAYLIPYLQSNSRILDVGCGPGTISIDMAQRCSPGGHVTAIEYVEDPLPAARERAVSAGVTNITFEVGDVHNLKYDDNTFDIVHAHQVLQHIKEPIQGFKEMRRVCKIGGIVALRESASITYYPQPQILQDYTRLVSEMRSARGNNPHPGARIHVWAQEAGFPRDKITCSVGTWLYSTPEEKKSWSETWAGRALQPSFVKMAHEEGLATKEQLEAFAQAWRDWGNDPDSWCCILHGEIICRKE